MKKDDKKSKELNELNQKIIELTNGWQRTQADFMNYKKQVSDEKAKLTKTANAGLIAELLPVLDNFQLAARHLPQNLQNDNWAQGVQQIEKQFEGILLESGLKRIEALGSQFDPEYHEAIEEVECNKSSGEIVEEVATGYTYDNIVLRPSKVKVAK
ncbi:MAG: heat shock protein GrpE [bacterium ADurb.Bin212]|nr:MAG: heat shock protein GrpE [bacterium ADurb.Bin212]